MSDPLVQLNTVSRRFGNTQALIGVSFDIPRGSVFGLVGENGAGKSTLLRHILGLLKPDQGSVRVFGLDPVTDPAAVLERIGYLSEDRDMPDWMRVDQLMAFQSSFYPKWDHGYADELLQMFELRTDQKIKTLSRGQRARVGLLLAVAHRPDLLVLDEPSSGLDPVVRRDILAAIVRTVADEGRTVLFSSHLLDEVQRVSDHVAIISAGHLLVCDRLESILEQHHRWTVRLAEPALSPPGIPGSISCRGEGCEWDVICNGQSDAVETWVSSHNAEIIETARPSLEEIFVARIG